MKISKLDQEGLEMSFKMQYHSAIEHLIQYLRNIPKDKAYTELHQMVQSGVLGLSVALQLEECIDNPKAEVEIRLEQ